MMTSILKTWKLLFLLLLVSCDFSDQVHRDILEIQEDINAHKFDLAIKRYEAVLKKNPSKNIQLKIYFQLGELYLLYLNDSKSAKKYFKKIIKETQDPVWLVRAQEKLGEINFSFLKIYPEAIDAYQKLVNFRPKLARYDFYEFQLGLSYLKMEDYHKAYRWIDTITKDADHEYHVRSFYFMGLYYFELKEWKKAISYWKKYIVREKRKDLIIETRFLIANVYETSEELKKAYDIYYSILGEYPNPEVIKNRLKSIYLRRVARKR